MLKKIVLILSSTIYSCKHTADFLFCFVKPSLEIFFSTSIKVLGVGNFDLDINDEECALVSLFARLLSCWLKCEVNAKLKIGQVIKGKERYKGREPSWFFCVNYDLVIVEVEIISEKFRSIFILGSTCRR